MKILKLYPKFSDLIRDLNAGDFTQFNRSTFRGTTPNSDQVQYLVFSEPRDIQKIMGQVFDRVEFGQINPQFHADIMDRRRPE